MIFVTGDTHGLTLNKLSSKNWLTGKTLSKKDYVVVAGDFGVLWTVEDKSEIYWLKWLSEKPWTTLFIDGNHDPHPRLNQLEAIDMFNGKVGRVNDSVFHLKRGQVYNIDNRLFFCFGGAKSTDKHARKEGVNWWPEEIPSYIETDSALDNLDKVNNCVDYIISHTAPITAINLLGKNYQDDTTSKFLEHIIQNVQFKKLFCGHFHTDKTIHKFRFLYDNIELIQ